MLHLWLAVKRWFQRTDIPVQTITIMALVTMWIYIQSGWLWLIESGPGTPKLHEAFSGKAVQSCQGWWRGLLSPVLESHHLYQIFCGMVGFSKKVKHQVTNNPRVSLPGKHTRAIKTHPLGVIVHRCVIFVQEVQCSKSRRWVKF